MIDAALPNHLRALIEEAWRRARLRRSRYAALALVVAIAAGAVVYVEVSRTQASSASALIPTCTPGDYRLTVGESQPATQMLIGAVSVTEQSGPCSFAGVVRLSVLDENGATIASPRSLHMTGKLSATHPLAMQWAWGEWCGGKTVTFRARIPGGPQASSSATAPPGRCDSSAPPRLALLRR